MYKSLLKLNHNLRIVLAILMMCVVTHNGFAQKVNVLNMPSVLNDLRIGATIDTAIFKRISQSEPVSKQLLIYKIDYSYSGPSINILDSVKVDNLLIGTSTNGVIQSIIVLCKNGTSLRTHFLSQLGHYATVSSFSLEQSKQQTEIWHKEDYALSLNTSTSFTGVEKDAIIILYDSDYSHLFKKELMGSISN